MCYYPVILRINLFCFQVFFASNFRGQNMLPQSPKVSGTKNAGTKPYSRLFLVDGFSLT